MKNRFFGAAACRLRIVHDQVRDFRASIRPNTAIRSLKRDENRATNPPFEMNLMRAISAPRPLTHDSGKVV